MPHALPGVLLCVCVCVCKPLCVLCEVKVLDEFPHWNKEMITVNANQKQCKLQAQLFVVVVVAFVCLA